MGVDHGLKRIGLAVSDTLQKMAMPLTTLQAKSSPHNAREFRRFRDEYGVVGWVIGLPLHMTGEESPQSRIVREFGAWLRRETERPIVFQDERLSSSAAETVLWSLGKSPQRHKERIDSYAAQAILQTYLDRRAVESKANPNPPDLAHPASSTPIP